ncbi:pyoverdine synthetase I [Xenorhabdus mauleonii]|uniref:Phosphopantetheine attachment site n=2 Tax=Xenorhabdus mauleonii TaxID=351675 RepID=A0A1I3LXF4_9GAMM|nr:pyoverdine synthetase I [Xenorhabdus mauleonii]SFI89448.1 Phosphopantetheine attachment site [Xenorhabdus mauleonii]
MHKQVKDTEPYRAQPVTWLNFNTIEEISSLLQAGTFETFGISAIPNARIKDDVEVAEGLRYWSANQLLHPPEYAGKFSPQATKQVQAFESLFQYAEQCGYQCGLTWSQQQPDLLDVIFSRGALPQIQARAVYSQTHLANYPQLSSISGELSEHLESALKKHLPEYMVPSLYITLERMPLSLNNKIDKKALPTPIDSDLRQQTYIAPETEIEIQICRLWQDLLKVHQVGLRDNFFTLGGHSLQAIRLISLIRNELHIEIPLKSIFENPTLEKLSQLVTVHLIQTRRKHAQTEQGKTQILFRGDI